MLGNGRVGFGIGRGSLPTHFSGFGGGGGGGGGPTESRQRMLEDLDMIRQIWTHYQLSFQGQFFQVENISLAPRPVQQPHSPIRVAANSTKTFELMGRLSYPILWPRRSIRSPKCGRGWRSIARPGLWRGTRPVKGKKGTLLDPVCRSEPGQTSFSGAGFCHCRVLRGNLGVLRRIGEAFERVGYDL